MWTSMDHFPLFLYCWSYIVSNLKGQMKDPFTQNMSQKLVTKGSALRSPVFPEAMLLLLGNCIWRYANTALNQFSLI